jgi:hypothetical protein
LKKKLIIAICIACVLAIIAVVVSPAGQPIDIKVPVGSVEVILHASAETPVVPAEVATPEVDAGAMSTSEVH